MSILALSYTKNLEMEKRNLVDDGGLEPPASRM